MIEKLIIEKRAQLAVLNALYVQMCSCECESKYIDILIKQIEKELEILIK